MTRFNAKTTCDEVLRGRDLSGRAMLITGANSGIGFETARSLAAAGAHVLLACRSAASAQAALERIRAQQPDATLTPLELELGSLESVRRCAQAVRVTKLHALICNAGLFMSSYAETQDGIERTVGVSHFGHFLLASLLRDRLRAASPARVVMVSSESHRFPPTLRFERFPMRADNYSALAAYGQAKLCNVLFANELTRRYGAEGIFANSLHPGSFIGTQIFRDTVGARLFAGLIRPLTKSLAQGAATTVYCATAPELEGAGGRYYVDCREKQPSRFTRNEQAAERLWTLSEARVGATATHTSSAISEAL